VQYFLAQTGWNINYNLNVNLDENLEHLIEAYVDSEEWIIRLKYNKEILEIFKYLLDEYELHRYLEKNALQIPKKMLKTANIKFQRYKYINELYNFISGIAFHEFGHSKECPIDSNSFAEILLAINTFLETQNKKDPLIRDHIANMFMDLIVNTVYGLEDKNSFFRNSFIIFYLSELVLFKFQDISFLIFIILNLKLFLFNQSLRDLFEKMIFTKLPEKSLNVIKKLLKLFCPFDDIYDYLWVGLNPDSNDKWKIINYLSDKREWPRMVYNFAKLIYPFISINLLKMHKPIEDSVFIEKFHKDPEFKKEILRKAVEKKFFSVNILERSNKNKRKYNEGISSNQNKNKNKNKNQNKYNNMFKLSEKYPNEFNMDYGLSMFEKVEILDEIYKYRIKQMKITLENIEDQQYPIIWLNKEMINEQENPLDFDPYSIIFLPNSDEILMYRRTTPFNIPLKGEITEKSFPDLAIFCDTSGSMNWNPYKGDGKYDALIIAIYSLFEWLKFKEFAPTIKYNFIFFSNTTKESGWKDYFNLDSIKKLLFSPERGGTFLNPNILKKVIKTPKEKIIILITDGIIYNEREIYNILKINKNNMIFLLIQIGIESNLAKMLKDNGFNVAYIQNINRLNYIILNFIKDYY